MKENFDLNVIYEMGDYCTFDEYVWKYVGLSLMYEHQIRRYVGNYFAHTQVKTIGVYPSEKLGWRRRGLSDENTG